MMFEPQFRSFPVINFDVKFRLIVSAGPRLHRRCDLKQVFGLVGIAALRFACGGL